MVDRKFLITVTEHLFEVHSITFSPKITIAKLPMTRNAYKFKINVNLKY